MASTKTVLLIDDDPDLRQLMGITLELDGYHVIEAENGKEALTQIQQERPDLIMLDMMMPVMDGLSFVTELRRDPLQNIPVLALTAMDNAGSRQQVLDAGANDILFKPANTATLLTKVAEMLRT